MSKGSLCGNGADSLMTVFISLCPKEGHSSFCSQICTYGQVHIRPCIWFCSYWRRVVNQHWLPLLIRTDTMRLLSCAMKNQVARGKRFITYPVKRKAPYWYSNRHFFPPPIHHRKEYCATEKALKPFTNLQAIQCTSREVRAGPLQAGKAILGHAAHSRQRSTALGWGFHTTPCLVLPWLIPRKGSFTTTPASQPCV